MSCLLIKEDLDRLFPAYLQVDTEGIVLSAGHSLIKHAGTDVLFQSILEVFDVERPFIFGAMSDLLKHGGSCVLRLKSNSNVRLQGAVQEDSGTFFLFLGYVPSMKADDTALSLTFSDFAPFDASKDLIVASQIRQGLLSDVEDLVVQLKAEKNLAETANRSKSEFLACMSHEIRTPLNGVLGLAALLERTELDVKQTGMLTSLRQCGTSLLELLNDIIDIARMDAEKFEIVEEPILPGDIADRVCNQYSIIADGKNISLRVETDEMLRANHVHCDGGRLFQIVNNLVSNAIKFTHKGQVRMDLSDMSPTDAQCAEIHICVQDTGIGMAPEHLEQVFEPFKQADAGITREFGGTGLGLTICKRLCEMMDGTISVESTPGVGSRFDVRLPLRRVQARLAS